ncbi:hypothetical protein BSM4216_2134 [Bacillus smithii]|nr:hypothetical protein BSM4216_2134 [Bacillus smithii]
MIVLVGLIELLDGVYALLFSDLAKRKNTADHKMNMSIG